jgi:hypothetical protein
MSSVGRRGRSYRSISIADLRSLAVIAKRDREAFFGTHPEWKHLYAGRVLCVALCQGAAKHYINGTNGINDFDVYTFYRAHPSKTWYAKRLKSYDFGSPKFGRSVDRPDYRGRRVDCLGRSIKVLPRESAADALHRYLQEGRTETAKLLGAKAVVLLEPSCGQVVWPR